MNITIEQWLPYPLIFFRVAGILMMAPVFGSRNIPMKLKVGLSLLITVLLIPLISRPAGGISGQLLPYVLLIAKEVSVGIVLGYVSTLVFSGIQMAGGILGRQMGFSLINVIDPQSGQQVDIIGQIYYLVAIMIFLLINGHHWLLKALAASFEIVPLTSVNYSSVFSGKIVEISADIFVTAVKISAPGLAVLLLISVALGLLAKSAPQMNVFLMGFPLRIGAGILAIAFSLPLFFYFLRGLFAGMYRDMNFLLHSM